MKMYEDQSEEFVCEYWGLQDQQEQYIEIAIIILKAGTVLVTNSCLIIFWVATKMTVLLSYMYVLFQNQENCTPSTKIMRFWCSRYTKRGGGGGGGGWVASLIWAIYMGYIGICGPKGYGFLAFLVRSSFLAFLVRSRVSI